MLAPIAWRTPPRHYGPWEQVVSLLTEGLVARGVDVTLFATGDSMTTAHLVSVCARGYEEDRSVDAKVWEALHIAELAALLSPDERARALRLVREADRHRFIAGRALLRRTLAGCLGVPAEAIRFDYSAAGKPALAAGFEASDLRFNASASGGVALVALRHGGDVGVDVERIRAARDGVAASVVLDAESAGGSRTAVATWMVCGSGARAAAGAAGTPTDCPC